MGVPTFLSPNRTDGLRVTPDPHFQSRDQRLTIQPCSYTLYLLSTVLCASPARAVIRLSAWQHGADCPSLLCSWISIWPHSCSTPQMSLHLLLSLCLPVPGPAPVTQKALRKGLQDRANSDFSSSLNYIEQRRLTSVVSHLRPMDGALLTFGPSCLCLNSKVSSWHTRWSSETSQESYTVLGSFFKIWFVFISATQWPQIIFLL